METKQKERIRRLMELLKKTDRIHLKEAARMLEGLATARGVQLILAAAS